jgi:S-DNA-T family DNA segregation ATPase FtsK/SpoIIIE
MAKSKKISRKYDKHYKIISVLLIVFALLLFFSLISYSKSDQSNTQISFGELLSLFFGNEEIKAKAATTKNWLSLFGAVISNFFYYKTVGIWIIGLPYFIVIWSVLLYTGNEITTKIIRNTSVYFVIALLLSALTGTMNRINWIFDIPYEFIGNIGEFLSDTISSIIGVLGAFLVFTAGIVITLIIGTDIKFSKYFKIGKSIGEDIKESSKSIINDVKDDIKVKLKHNENDTIEQTESKKYDNHDNKSVENKSVENNSEEINNQDDDEELNLHILKKSPNIKIIRPKQIKNPDDLTSKQEMYENQNTEKPNIIDHSKDENINEINQVIDEKNEHDTKEEKTDQTIHNTKDDKVFYTEEDTKNIARFDFDDEDDKEEVENDDNSIQEDTSEDDFSDNNEFEQRKELTINVKKKEIKERSEPSNLLGTDIHDEEINYNPPGFQLLSNKSTLNEVSETELKMNAQILQEKLETFKIFIEDLGVTPGPVVTQYEFVPAAGIKISKIESLADDLAMALKAKGIRIIAPIPEKGTVGIEIPNSKPSTVTFYDVAKSNEFIDSKAELPLALGKMIDGDVFTLDLSKMPHLLIAGSTGSGKSVGINTIIASLIFKKHPSELKFVLVDPKKVELMQYALLRDHFLAVSPDIDTDIVNTPADAVVVLKATVVEMERRYDLLAKVGQRNLKDYNKKVKEGKIKDTAELKHRPMPYIVVIIDELADLMLTAAKEVEEPITRLAQMARAVGIHLILATQRPSVDVITGLIKANFPARISYAVTSKIDSRTILDMQGAETLLGMGDMLCLPAGQAKPIRIQNSFIDTDEIEDICNFISEQDGYSSPYMLPSLIEDSGMNEAISAEDRDPLFEEAARLIIRNQQGSVSLLQRRLKIGYARAGRIVDELESAGVVGPFDGSKARQVLMESESELEAVL